MEKKEAPGPSSPRFRFSMPVEKLKPAKRNTTKMVSSGTSSPRPPSNISESQVPSVSHGLEQEIRKNYPPSGRSEQTADWLGNQADLPDVLIQRLRGCIIRVLDQESRILSQRVAEVLAKQQQMLLDGLSRVESEQARLALFIRGDGACPETSLNGGAYYGTGVPSPVALDNVSMPMAYEGVSMFECEEPLAEPERHEQPEALARHMTLDDRSIQEVESPRLDTVPRAGALVENVTTDLAASDLAAPEVKQSRFDNESPQMTGKHIDLRGRSQRFMSSCNTINQFIADTDGFDLNTPGGKKAYLDGLAVRLPPSGFLEKGVTTAGKFIEWWEGTKEPKRSGLLLDLICHPCFVTLSMMAVVGDQLLTTWRADYAVANVTTTMPFISDALAWAFNIFFFLECFLKLIVHRQFFFCNGQWKMNCLDFFLVVYSFLEFVAVKLSFLRILRMFKMAKIVRMLKALASVHDLRIMLDCLLGSFFGLFWALVLIGVLMYIFALIFVQALTDYLIEHGDDISDIHRARIDENFGSVWQGWIAVYKMLTGGLDWGEMYAILLPTGPIAPPACIMMIAFFTISVWNIITSVFIEKAMEMAQPTIREQIRKKKIQTKIDAKEVGDLITKLDHDSTGAISKDEFKDLCQNQDIREFLLVRDLDIGYTVDLDSFFEMIYNSDPDATPGREVSVKGVVNAWLHLKGHATQLDLHCLQHELDEKVRLILDQLKALTDVVESKPPKNGKQSRKQMRPWVPDFEV